MELGNGEHGYGVVTKLLHWLTVIAIATQFAIGYSMDPDAAADRADQRVAAFEGRGEGLAKERGEAAEERFEAQVERRATPLPPWAEHLAIAERTLESWLEKALLTLLLVVPASGLLLAFTSDALLPVHIAAQMALLGTVALHVGLVLKHTVVRRNRHLSRML